MPYIYTINGPLKLLLLVLRGLLRLSVVVCKNGIDKLASHIYIYFPSTVRTVHETMDLFQIGKRVRQGCILSLCLFNLYVEYIMGNARLDEVQVGIMIVRRNVNSLRYADDTTLMGQNKEKL